MIDSLKVMLGTVGRADFLTSHESIPGDLFYPVERVVVFVRSCHVYGCPDHLRTERVWVERVRANAARAKEEVEAAKAAGWASITFWDCEAAQSPERVAEEIVALLSQARTRGFETLKKTIGPELALARVARVDATTKVPIEAWREFLQITIDACGSYKGAAYRKDIFAVLLEKEWTENMFNDAWRVAMHHRIIKSTVHGTKPGAMMKHALQDAGIKPSWNAGLEVRKHKAI